MDVMYQVDQSLRAGTSAAQATRQTSSSQDQSADRADFDSMVRQKQQERNQPTTNKAKTNESQKAKDTKTSEKDEVATEDTQPEQEIPNEQYVLAAALMMFQTKVDNQDVDPVNVATDLTEAPVVTTEEVPRIVEHIRHDIQRNLDDRPLRREDRPSDFTVRPTFERRDVEEIAPEREEQIEMFVEVTEEQIEETPIIEEMIVQGEQVEEETAEEQAEVIQWDSPLFGYLNTTPVKVAQPEQTAETPIPLEAEDGMEQLGGRIEQVLVEEDTGTSHIELTLDPPSLGKISVELTHTEDGTLRILIHASTSRAAEILDRSASGLQHLLTSYARPNVQVEVEQPQEGLQHILNPDAQNGQQQQRQQQRRQQQQQPEHVAHDFIQQLRLGLVGGVETED